MSTYQSTADRYVVPSTLSTRCSAAQSRFPARLLPEQPVETAVPCLQLSRKQTTVAFGPEDPHQHDMSHANKLAQLAYSKRAHSEWSLLQKWEADVEKLSVQERKELLAKLKVHFCLCNVRCGDMMMSGVYHACHAAHCCIAQHLGPDFKASCMTGLFSMQVLSCSCNCCIRTHMDQQSLSVAVPLQYFTLLLLVTVIS